VNWKNPKRRGTKNWLGVMGIGKKGGGMGTRGMFYAKNSVEGVVDPQIHGHGMDGVEGWRGNFREVEGV